MCFILLVLFLIVTDYDVTGKINSPSPSENSNGPTIQNDAQLNVPNTTTGNSSPQAFPGFAEPNDVKEPGRSMASWLLPCLAFFQYAGMNLLYIIVLIKVLMNVFLNMWVYALMKFND